MLQYTEGTIPPIGISLVIIRREYPNNRHPRMLVAMTQDEEQFSSIGMGYHHLSWDKQNWYDMV